MTDLNANSVETEEGLSLGELLAGAIMERAERDREHRIIRKLLGVLLKRAGNQAEVTIEEFDELEGGLIIEGDGKKFILRNMTDDEVQSH